MFQDVLLEGLLLEGVDDSKPMDPICLFWGDSQYGWGWGIRMGSKGYRWRVDIDGLEDMIDRGGYSLEIGGTIPFSNYGHEAKFNDRRLGKS